jgi:alcohol dehydrogenase class IV
MAAMALVTWSFPTTIVFGSGALGALTAHARRVQGTCALVVTDPGVVKAGIIKKVAAELDAANIPHTVFDAVDPNPVEKNVTEGVDAFRERGADFIITVGGGAPLDTGKLIALKVRHDRPLVDYDDATGGDQFITPDVPPILAIPTTAGTGSEVGRSGVVTLEATGRKTVIFSPYLLAKAAILDPDLTLSLPPNVTAATGFDALTHCLEAYVSVGDHPMADAIAKGGLELCAKYLETAVNNGGDVAARGGMMKAAAMGAVAFQKGLGACHSLAHPLSSEKGLHHGLANALCLPAVVRWNHAGIGEERWSELARVLHAQSGDVAGALVDLRRRVGLPGGLREVGVSEADVPKLADKAFEDACHRCNPRPVTRDDLAALYRASL